MKKIFKLFKYNKYYWKGQVEPANTHVKHRSASWLELFLDLVLVAGLGLLIHGLVENYNIYGLFITCVYFFLIWSSWNSLTMYSHFFEQRGILHRFLILVNLISSALILLPYSSNYSDYINSSKLLLTFVVAVLMSRVIMLLTWTNAYKKAYNKYLKLLLKGRVKAYFVSVFISILALFFVNINASTVLALILSISINELFLMSIYKGSDITKQNRKFFHLEHIVERFGLFTMLIIGEAILAVVNNIQGINITFTEIILLIMLFLFIFLLWFLYYELIMNKAIVNLRRWKYAHLFLHFSFILVAVSINMNLHDKEIHLYKNLIIISTIFYFLSMIAMKRTLDLKETLGEENDNLDETNMQKALTKMLIGSIVFLLVLIFIPIHSLLVVILLINFVLILNIVVYYYNYIKLMNDIMW